MAYYGGGGQQHMYPGPQGQGPPPNSQMYGNQGQGPPHPGMFYGGPSQGVYNNDYNGSNGQPPYGQPQQQDYYPPQQQGQMYDQQNHGPHNAGMGGGPGPGPTMQSGRDEPIKILRNPFPTTSVNSSQSKNDIYDPSVPTSHRMAPPPPIISGGIPPSSGASSMASMAGTQSSVHSQGPMFTGGNAPAYGLPENSNMPMQMGNMGIYNNNLNYGNNNMAPPHQTAPTPVPDPSAYQSYPNLAPAPAPFGNSNSNVQQQEPQSTSKLQVMTGVVTQIQPGAFGMVSGEIFYQENVVSGPAPKVGDKVVVEAEAVQGMPFKFNAKRVTRLDIDLVHEEKNVAPQPVASPVFQQQYQPQAQQAHQAYQTQPYQTNPQQNFQMNDPVSRFETPSFGPLPSLPDSLNLPRPVPPPNLASVIPTSSSHSNAPLKSILKRKGSPSRGRNPPPPPVISKNAGQQDVNPFKSSAPTSLKQSSSAFTVDLQGNLPRVIPPQGSGAPIEFSEFSYVNSHSSSRSLGGEPAPASPRVLRLLPRSPILEYSGRVRTHPDEDSSNLTRRERQRSLSRDRNIPKSYRNRSRSKSPARGRSSRRSRSRSVSPRGSRSRRSRSSRSKSPSRRRHTRTPSPRKRRASRSKSPSRRRHTRTPSPRNRRRSRSRSPSPSPRSRRRSRSRSVSPKIRRRVSRSRSNSKDRDRNSDSRVSRAHRSRWSRSKSRSKSPYSRSKARASLSPPPSSSGAKVLAETVTHGIVVKTVSSDLFPRLAPKKTEEIIRRDGKPIVKAVKGEKPVVPIKFQISAPTTTASTIVPNPVFKTVTTSATFLQNPLYNGAGSAAANQKDKKKKPKEQEPAFRIIDDDSQQQPKKSTTQGPSESSDEKIKQWERERQALKSKIVENISNSANSNLLKNPVKILELKQTIQNDLQELRSKGKGDAGKNLLENPVDIEKLKQTVQRDLKELQSKSNETTPAAGPLVANKNFDEDVEKRLKELRSKFETHVKDAKATTSKPTTTISNVSKKPVNTAPTPKPPPIQQKVILVDNHLKEKRIPVAERRFPGKPVSDASSGHSRPQNRSFSPERSDFPPYDEHMERLQEEIHQQRFAEEEARLRAMGDQNGLQQLYYMEDRRRRRIEERHLAHLRMTEIQLKKDKNFGELARLREEWGPPAQRFEQERELRQIRQDEEMRANQLHGQAEAIRRQEMEYQRWLEEEAAARSRGMQESARPSRGFEGRVKRRRTPSPSERGGPVPTPQHPGPPPQARGSHPLRRRSRSPSFERYREDWRHRNPRERSPLRNYEQFVMRYPLVGPPMHSMPPEYFPPNHPGFPNGPPEPRYEDREGLMISRAMDAVERRQDELMHREMEIQRRIEVAQRKIAAENSGAAYSSRDGDREEIRRYVVPRR